MKKLVVLFFVFAMSTTTTFANTNDKRKDDGKALRTEIMRLIGSYNTDRTVTAQVSFMINQKGEIVVLSVNSSNKDLEYYLKATLNYQSVKKIVAKRMKVYKLPLKIVKA